MTDLRRQLDPPSHGARAVQEDVHGGIDADLATGPLEDANISHRDPMQLPGVQPTMTANLAPRQYGRLQQSLELRPQGDRCPLGCGHIFRIERLHGLRACRQSS